MRRAAGQRRRPATRTTLSPLQEADSLMDLEFVPAPMPEDAAHHQQQQLTAEDVRHFNSFGFTLPITVFSGEALASLQRTFANFSDSPRVAGWRDPRH